MTISFTVKPVALGSGTPSGNVVITDLEGDSCTGTVAAGNCSIAFAFSGLKLLVATYLGNSNYDESITAQIPQNVVDFTIAASPATEKVSQGGETTYSVTLTPLNGFSGTVSLACGGAPANTTCTVSPLKRIFVEEHHGHHHNHQECAGRVVHPDFHGDVWEWKSVYRRIDA